MKIIWGASVHPPYLAATHIAYVHSVPEAVSCIDTKAVDIVIIQYIFPDIDNLLAKIPPETVTIYLDSRSPQMALEERTDGNTEIEPGRKNRKVSKGARSSTRWPIFSKWFPSFKTEEVLTSSKKPKLMLDNARNAAAPVETSVSHPVTRLSFNTDTTSNQVPAIVSQEHAPSLSGFLLGPFHLFLNEASLLNWHSKKGRSLLAYLLFNHKQPTPRDILMDKFWRDFAPDSARNSLNVAIHGIRKLFKKIDASQEYVQFKNDCYQLNPDIPVHLDCQDFMSHWYHAQQVDRTQSLEAAIPHYSQSIELYRGEFLEEELLDDNWAKSPRAKMLEAYTHALDRLSSFYLSEAQVDYAIQLCNKIIEKDNCREDIHRRLMQCFNQNGQRDKAIKQFLICEHILLKELDVSPSNTTVDLLNRIKST